MPWVERGSDEFKRRVEYWRETAEALWEYGGDTRLMNVLAENVADIDELRAVTPDEAYYWPRGGLKTLNILADLLEWPRGQSPQWRPYAPPMSRAEAERLTLEGMAKRLRKAGWTVIPPEDKET